LHRGFVATFIACALATLIMLLVAYSQPSFAMRDRYLADYSAAATVRQLFGNTAAQLSVITGINSTFNSTADGYANATFCANFPLVDSSANVTRYAAVLSDDYSSFASAAIVPDFSAISSGRVAVLSNTTAFFTDYVSQSAGFAPVPSTTATGIRNLSIYFSTSSTLSASTAWSYDAGGDTNVTLVFVHAGGTVTENGLLNSNSPHYYWFNFSGPNKVAVYYGSAGTNTGVLRVNSTAVSGALRTSAIMPYWNASTWYYNASLFMSKAAINRTSKLMVWEGG
jgi:hypothetical protein